MQDWRRKEGAPILREVERDGVVMLTFPLLEETGIVRQGFSTRMGGVSTGDCATMNFSYDLGDAPEAVMENIRRFVTAMGADPAKTVMSKQTHTTNVRVVTEEDAGKGYSQPRDYRDVDGLVTNVPGLVLLTTYADCVPLYFVDPVHRAIGLSHSGWRGTVQKMGAVTLSVMAQEYGTKPEEVYAAIGPSICQDCYEVSADVIEQFRANFPESCWEDLFYLKDAKREKYQLNLWNANRYVLLSAGILPEHQQITDLCTCCNAALLHSHRATGGRRGLLAAFLSLKE